MKIFRYLSEIEQMIVGQWILVDFSTAPQTAVFVQT
jgi:hypothetical protein